MPRKTSIRAKPGRYKLKSQRTCDQVKKLKQELLDILVTQAAENLSEACKLLGLKPYEAYLWSKNDEEWAEQIKLCKQALADRLEKELQASPNIIAKIFLLKGLRPEIYRDNYNKPDTSNTVVETINELRRLAREQVPEVEPAPATEAPKIVDLPQLKEANAE